MLLRLSRTSRTTLLTGVLLALVGVPLVLLAALSTNPVGPRTLSILNGWGQRKSGEYVTPTSLVLKGKTVGKGLDWQDRLVDGELYFTAGVLGGVTNQVISAANIIHIALLTSRVPIIPNFYGYIPQLGGDLVTLPLHDMPFSHIFDLPGLFDILRGSHGLRGIIEWEQLLNYTTGYDLKLGENETEVGWRAWNHGQWNDTTDWVEMGCWAAHTPGLPEPLWRLRIDPTYTPLPPAVLNRPQIHLPSLTSYLHTESPLVGPYLDALEGTTPSDLLPDQRVACIDNAYYAHVTRFVSSEWAGDGDTRSVGSWPAVGTHMHWKPVLQSRADQVARWVFRVKDKDPVPEFVSVHIRHGDFLKFCPNVQGYEAPPPTVEEQEGETNTTRPPPPPKPTCLSASLFDAAVTAQQTALWRETGTSVRNVLFTTDEEDEEFLHELEFVFGWKRVKEEMSLRIRREWGDWYPTLIDNVLLSMGKAFVGTQHSTMSILSARRVEDWNDGPASLYVRHASEAWSTNSAGL